MRKAGGQIGWSLMLKKIHMKNKDEDVRSNKYWNNDCWMDGDVA